MLSTYRVHFRFQHVCELVCYHIIRKTRPNARAHSYTNIIHEMVNIFYFILAFKKIVVQRNLIYTYSSGDSHRTNINMIFQPEQYIIYIERDKESKDTVNLTQKLYQIILKF
jgi:hypothetical protein